MLGFVDNWLGPNSVSEPALFTSISSLLTEEPGPPTHVRQASNRATRVRPPFAVEPATRNTKLPERAAGTLGWKTASPTSIGPTPVELMLINRIRVESTT